MPGISWSFGWLSLAELLYRQCCLYLYFNLNQTMAARFYTVHCITRWDFGISFHFEKWIRHLNILWNWWSLLSCFVIQVFKKIPWCSDNCMPESTDYVKQSFRYFLQNIALKPITLNVIQNNPEKLGGNCFFGFFFS